MDVSVDAPAGASTAGATTAGASTAGASTEDDLCTIEIILFVPINTMLALTDEINER